MGVLAGVLPLSCLVVAAVHLWRLAVVPRSAVAEAAQVVMALGMAAMMSPAGNPLPVVLWAVVFVVCYAWFAARALSRRDDHAAHHATCAGAMLFMVLAGHEHRGMAASVFAVALVGYFGWHVLRCNDIITAPRVAPEGGAGLVATPRVAAGASGAMAALMGVMLLGMV